MIAVNPAGFRYQYPEGRRRPEGYEGDWITTFAEHRRLLYHLARHHPGEDVERIVVLGLYLGLRKDENMGADWEGLDLDAAELHVRRAYTRGKGGAHVTAPKTPKSVRTVPVMSPAVAPHHHGDAPPQLRNRLRERRRGGDAALSDHGAQGHQDHDALLCASEVCGPAPSHRDPRYGGECGKCRRRQRFLRLRSYASGSNPSQTRQARFPLGAGLLAIERAGSSALEYG